MTEDSNPAGAELSRREFMGRSLTAGAGCTVLGCAILLRPPGSPGDENDENDENGEAELLHGTYDRRDHLWGFVCDTTLCIGCGSCVRACSEENRVPEGFHRTWVERYEIARDETISVDSPGGAIDGFRANAIEGEEPLMKAFFVPKLCNHCSESACTQVCPVGATFHSPDGVVLIDRKQCLGCGYCVQACPYGCRYIHTELGMADKCTLCYHRITRGLETACVQACPVGARLCGNLADEDSPIRKKLRERRYGLLKPDLGTRPKNYYIGLDLEVI